MSCPELSGNRSEFASVDRIDRIVATQFVFSLVLHSYAVSNRIYHGHQWFADNEERVNNFYVWGSYLRYIMTTKVVL